jgi:hypothetical protein
MPKPFPMVAQQRREHPRIGWVTLGDHFPLANQTVFDFGIVDLVPEFCFMWRGFAPPDNLGVRLAQTDQLVRRWNGFALKHSPHGLVHRTLD